MILNNTHVQGMFLYSEETEYEKGDLLSMEILSIFVQLKIQLIKQIILFLVLFLKKVQIITHHI